MPNRPAGWSNSAKENLSHGQLDQGAVSRLTPAVLELPDGGDGNPKASDRSGCDSPFPWRSSRNRSAKKPFSVVIW